MRALLFTTGSPFARAVRIILDEIGLDWDRREEITTPTVAERAAATPTLQVPTLWDGERVLWESGVIAEYLMHQYATRVPSDPMLAAHFVRPDHEWDDRLVFATVQTLGTAATTISQMKWTGLQYQDNDYLTRCAERLPHLLDWLEGRLVFEGVGFFGNELSAQDVFLCCHLDFIANRPLGLETEIERYPRIDKLIHHLRKRLSFEDNPIVWWEPGVIG